MILSPGGWHLELGRGSGFPIILIGRSFPGLDFRVVMAKKSANSTNASQIALEIFRTPSRGLGAIFGLGKAEGWLGWHTKKPTTFLWSFGHCRGIFQGWHTKKPTPFMWLFGHCRGIFHFVLGWEVTEYPSRLSWILKQADLI